MPINQRFRDLMWGWSAFGRRDVKNQAEGSDTSDRFAVLRHLVTLLFGENRGLEAFRSVVASRSGVDRTDVPAPYEPDQDIVPFEEADVSTRAKVSTAASWLFREWPARFIECCQEARVQYPALNRNAISVSSYCRVATTAYEPQAIQSDRKPIRSERSVLIRPEERAKG